MPGRNAAQLRADATATGMFNGPTLDYVGDGYSVPYECPFGRYRLTNGVLLSYKLYLDAFFKEYSRLHDWLYTPYGRLIQADQDESDRALREELAQDSPVDAEIVYQACATFGFLFFGTSAVGYLGNLPTWSGNNMDGAEPVITKEVNPAMAIKAVILFQQTTEPTLTAENVNYTGVARTGGWTESLYGPSDVPAITALLKGPRTPSSVFPLLQARANILNNAATIVGVRIYQSGAGKGQLIPAQYRGVYGRGDQPSAALAILATSKTAGKSRRWDIRGVPDDQIKNGEWAPTTDMAHRMKEYFNSLAGLGWLMKSSLNEVAIFNITAPGIITTRLVHGFGIGNIVTVKRSVNTASGLRQGGEFKVTGTPDATTITIAGWVGGACKGGTVSQDTTSFQDFAGADLGVRKATNHKIGRPFDSYRGRKSRKRLTA